MGTTTASPPGEQLTPDDLAKEISEAGLFLHIEDQSETDAYAALLAYRVQRDLYEVFMDEGDYSSMSWDNFCSIFKENRLLQAVAVAVLKYGILEQCTAQIYDFENVSGSLEPFRERDMEDSVDCEGDDEMNFIRLFPDEVGRVYVDAVMLRGQIIQYRQLRPQKKWSWEEYIIQLKEDHTLWAALLHAFRGALFHLDFKQIWMRDDLETLLTDSGRL